MIDYILALCTRPKVQKVAGNTEDDYISRLSLMSPNRAARIAFEDTIRCGENCYPIYKIWWSILKRGAKIKVTPPHGNSTWSTKKGFVFSFSNHNLTVESNRKTTTYYLFESQNPPFFIMREIYEEHKTESLIVFNFLGSILRVEIFDSTIRCGQCFFAIRTA